MPEPEKAEESGAPGRGTVRERRRTEKQRVIARAATTVFLRDGYVATSMDEVAALAGVSKQTVYAHFGSKEQLFLAVMEEAIDGVLDDFFAALARSFPGSSDLEGDLVRLGRILLTRILHPELMALRRLVIAEVGRFPQLGQAWYESGPGALIEALAARLQELGEVGDLHVEDPRAAAADFNWLVVSKPQNMMLFGIADRFTSTEIDRLVRAAVRVFLAAYAPVEPTATDGSVARDRHSRRRS